MIAILSHRNDRINLPPSSWRSFHPIPSKPETPRPKLKASLLPSSLRSQSIEYLLRHHRRKFGTSITSLISITTPSKIAYPKLNIAKNPTLFSHTHAFHNALFSHHFPLPFPSNERTMRTLLTAPLSNAKKTSEATPILLLQAIVCVWVAAHPISSLGLRCPHRLLIDGCEAAPFFKRAGRGERGHLRREDGVAGVSRLCPLLLLSPNYTRRQQRDFLSIFLPIFVFFELSRDVKYFVCR